MPFVKVKGFYAYMHPKSQGHRLEVIDPGSVVLMKDDEAEQFVKRGMGVEVDGPENLIRPGKDDPERPGAHPGPARAEQATGRAQRVGAV